jgi:hypothetical protein
VSRTALWLNIVFTVTLTIVSGVLVNEITETFTWALMAGLVIIATGLVALGWFDKRAQGPSHASALNTLQTGRFDNITIFNSTLSAVGQSNVIQVGAGNAAAPGDGSTAVTGKRNKIVHRSGLLAAITSLIVAAAVVGGAWLLNSIGDTAGTSAEPLPGSVVPR